MLQRLDCSKCGVNAADRDLIALPMTYICHDCYSKQKSLEERIKGLEETINLASDGIDGLSGYWPDGQMKSDVMAVKETLEQALKK